MKTETQVGEIIFPVLVRSLFVMDSCSSNPSREFEYSSFAIVMPPFSATSSERSPVSTHPTNPIRPKIYLHIH